MREALPCKLCKRLWETTQDLTKVHQDSCDILSEWVVHNMELSVGHRILHLYQLLFILLYQSLDDDLTKT
jgi:hypothetical protein